MIGIYKFTNKLTGESYIGQSENIHKRYLQHKNRHDGSTISNEDSYFHRMLRHYGFDNFTFEVIHECSKAELNSLEEYYIKKYNTLYPHGYNKTRGGNYVSCQKLDAETVSNIIEDLKLCKESELSLAKKYNVHLNTISLINLGKMWFNEDIDYPIRTHAFNVLEENQKRICPICGKTKDVSAERCIDCYNKIRASGIPSKETLLSHLLTLSFAATGRLYSVSGNTVKKWCAKHGLPTKAPYYKAQNNA